MTVQVLTLMFVAGSFVIALVVIVLELLKVTKNSPPNFAELTSYFLVL